MNLGIIEMNSNNNMMVGAADEQPKVERIGNEVFIQAGNFCRALEQIDAGKIGDHRIIPKGELLLISKLKYAHDLIHSVVIRPHPRWYLDYGKITQYNFLVEDFLDKFELVSREEGNKIRAQEMAQIQAQIQENQSEFFKIQANPEKLMNIALEIYSRRIESKDNKIDIPRNGELDAIAVIESGLTTEMVENLKDSLKKPQDLILIQANWLKEESQKIQKMYGRILPFMTEQAQAQNSSLDDVTSDINQRLSGLETLELYLGKDIVVHTIKEGDGAADDVKLSLVQEVLYADVELSLYTESAVHFDAGRKDQLWDEFKENQKFVDQIFPTERCIVLMRCNYEKKEYNDAWENAKQNQKNMKVFVLVRNGQNIYALFSPISSHLSASRLFPAKEEVERYLFRGNEKIQINVDDLAYSDKLSLVEREILHYKRFMLMIAGLDHRDNLFGDFYPKQEFMSMFYPEFQNKYFNFIHDADGEGMLPTLEEHRPSLYQYFRDANKRLTVGSRIVVDLNRVITPDSAPSCYVGRNNDRPEQKYRSLSRFMVLRVKSDKHGFHIKVPVENRWGMDTRSFEARVDLSCDLSINDLICLDLVTPQDLEFYITSRLHRRSFVGYIEMFKYAKSFIDKQYECYEPTIAYLNKALSGIPECQLSDFDKKSAVLQSINAWFVQNDSLKLLDTESEKHRVAIDGVLKQLYFRASPAVINQHKAFVEEYALKNSITPLKLTVDVNGTLWLYSELPIDEQFEQLEPNRFVNRSNFNVTKTGKTSVKSTSPVLINQYEPDEHNIVMWEGAAHYENICQPFVSFERNGKKSYFKFINYQSKKELTQYLDQGKNLITALFNQLEFGLDVAEQLVDAYLEQKEVYRKKKYFNQKVSYHFPIALIDNELYSVQVENSKELFETLQAKYFIGECEDINTNNSESFKPVFTVTKVGLSGDSLSNIIRNYKQNYTTHKLLTGFGVHQNEVSQMSKSCGGKLYSRLLLSLYVKSIIKDTQYGYQYGKNPTSKNFEAHVNFYSCFSVDDFFDIDNMALDKIVKNPYCTPECKVRQTSVLIWGRKHKNRDTVQNAKMVVSVGTASQIKDFEKTIPEWEHKEDMDFEIIKRSFSHSGLAVFTDVEAWFASLITKGLDGFFSYEAQTKNCLLSVNVRELNQLEIIQEQEDLLVFQVES